MQDRQDPVALLALQVLQVQGAQLALLDQWALLGRLAWVALVAPWVPPDRAETPAQRALREAPARRDRLARQALRVL